MKQLYGRRRTVRLTQFGRFPDPQYLTGYGKFSSHLKKYKITENNICRECRETGLFRPYIQLHEI